MTNGASVITGRLLSVERKTQETRLEAMRKESDQLESQLSAGQEALDRMIQQLSFDVKM
ncbi:MAG TPA: hypothetical protein VLY04_23195 [Bryobacteraceae bacterium]|nr:hypothetical protein [Bryobacteraceae bacterium]